MIMPRIFATVAELSTLISVIIMLGVGHPITIALAIATAAEQGLAVLRTL